MCVGHTSSSMAASLCDSTIPSSQPCPITAGDLTKCFSCSPLAILSCCIAMCLLLPADFIYSEYLTTLRRFEFRQLVWQIAQDYSAAALLLRLPGYVPMPAFTAIEDVPLVVRHARKSSAQVNIFA